MENHNITIEDLQHENQQERLLKILPGEDVKRVRKN